MRVGLIIEWLDAWRGGAETSTQQFIHHLVEFGINVDVYTRSHVASRPGMNVHTLRAGGSTRASRSRAFYRLVDRGLMADRPDVIHAISPSRMADVYEPRGGTVVETIQRNLALRQSRGSRALKRIAARLNRRQRWALAMERRILGEQDGPVVIALSDYVVRQLRTHYDMPANRIAKVFNGVDADDTEPATRQENRRQIRRLYGIAEQDLLVLSVAHNFKLKGVRHWLEAHAHLKMECPRTVRAIVLGKDRVLRWQRWCQRRGIADVVQFPGPTQRVRAFMHAADVLVHPTYYDPCSRVVLEGMSSGLPCITTRFDGAAEVIDHGENGFVLESPDDITSMIRHIQRLFDRDLHGRMSELAGKRALDFTMAAHARGVMQVYERIQSNVGTGAVSS